jgi:hypothetical protein
VTEQEPEPDDQEPEPVVFEEADEYLPDESPQGTEMTEEELAGIRASIASQGLEGEPPNQIKGEQVS